MCRYGGLPKCRQELLAERRRNASKDKHGAGAASAMATPGKTKHLQTLLVRPGLELCDCPGLVFPALVTAPPSFMCWCCPNCQNEGPDGAGH